MSSYDMLLFDGLIVVAVICLYALVGAMIKLGLSMLKILVPSVILAACVFVGYLLYGGYISVLH